MDKYRTFGILVLLVSLAILVIIPGWDKVMFLPGIPYGLVFVFHARIKRRLSPNMRKPIAWYTLLVFGSGMLLELLAYASNLGRIAAGERVYLFSSDLWRDLLIGFPHYLAVALTWGWVLRRYRLSVFQQALLIGLFWAIVVDEFSYLHALLAGDVVIFVVAGLLLVFGLNWPLLLFEDAIHDKYPSRVNGWSKFPIGFVTQIIPMLVLLMSALIVNALYDA